MRVEFNLRASLNALTPTSPIDLSKRVSVVRVEFDLRASLNAEAPDSPISHAQTGVNFRKETTLGTLDRIF